MFLGASDLSMAGEKSRYSLFAPTPDRLLRDMTTDRPDTTESPFTIDAGRVQIESNVFSYARSRPDAAGIAEDSFEFATTNVRIGLTNEAEINFVWHAYGSVRAEHGGVHAGRNSGTGGFDIRGKINFWGNDTFEQVGSALAVLPFVTLPTDAGNGISPEFVEGGFIVPLAVTLPHNFGLGINGGAVWIRNEDASGHHAEYTGTASLAYEWSDQLGTYCEIAVTLNTGDPRGDVVVLGGGLTYAVNDNLQLDAGVNFGVTDASDRFSPFIGLAQRF
jgi:hypothetical protein